MNTQHIFSVGDIVVPKGRDSVLSDDQLGQVEAQEHMVRRVKKNSGDAQLVQLTCTDGQFRWFDAGFFKRQAGT